MRTRHWLPLITGTRCRFLTAASPALNFWDILLPSSSITSSDNNCDIIIIICYNWYWYICDQAFSLSFGHFPSAYVSEVFPWVNRETYFALTSRCLLSYHHWLCWHPDPELIEYMLKVGRRSPQPRISLKWCEYLFLTFDVVRNQHGIVEVEQRTGLCLPGQFTLETSCGTELLVNAYSYKIGEGLVGGWGCVY